MRKNCACVEVVCILLSLVLLLLLNNHDLGLEKEI